MGQPADFLNGLDGADFIVGGHDGDQDGLVRNGLLHILYPHAAKLVHRQVSHLKALLFQPGAGMQHRVMLDGAGDDVVALIPSGEGRALDGPVVALGAAGSEVDFLGLGADGPSHLPAGGIHGAAGVAAGGVDAGGVAEALGKVGQHGLQHFGRNGGGCRVVKINSVHGHDSFVWVGTPKLSCSSMSRREMD